MNLLHVFSPRCCVVCQKIGGDLCLEHLNALCWNCQRPLDDWIWSALEYQDSGQDIVRAVKYEFLYSYTLLMAQLIALCFPNLVKRQGIECLMPVPLHRKRKAWRGFNQAERMAKELGKMWNIPVVTDALIRTSQTAPQASLNREGRTKISHSFQMVKSVKHKTVCLVDDVTTTGSTLLACKEALREAGVPRVLGLTFAQEL